MSSATPMALGSRFPEIEKNSNKPILSSILVPYKARFNKFRVKEMCFLLNGGLDKPPPRLAKLARRALKALGLWNTKAGVL